MDVERQGGRANGNLSFKGMQDIAKQKAKERSVSSTLIVFAVLNVIMLIVGSLHLNDCPIRRMIPIYLIVGGAVGIISKILPFVNRKLDMTLITYLVFGLFVFEIIWMFLGSYWVYGTKPIFTDKNLPSYCDKTAYKLAFWLLTVNWILIAITVVLMCCAAVCVSIIQ